MAVARRPKSKTRDPKAAPPEQKTQPTPAYVDDTPEHTPVGGGAKATPLASPGSRARTPVMEESTREVKDFLTSFRHR